MSYPEVIDKYMSYAIGLDLTAWRNGDAALIAGECQAMDSLISLNELQHTFPKTVRVGRGKRIQHRYDAGRVIGLINSTHNLQRAVFSYELMGACTTTGVADPYTHIITLGATQTPVNSALHYESELTSEDVRADLLGFVPKTLSTTCNEFADGYVAYQTVNREFAYSRFSAGDLAAPTKLDVAPYTWEDLVRGGITFTYNGTTVECDKSGVTCDDARVSSLTVRDSSGYPTKGKVMGFDYTVKLRVKSTGDMLKTIATTKKASYAGDLDLTLEWNESANRYIKRTYDKLYLVPESIKEKIVFDEEGWFTGYELLLEPYDDTSSLTIEENNKYDKTYYEND